ncbi:MAG: phosphoribosylformylglycinamidine synthase [Oscillospiraceae bacterium]
MSVFCLYVEKKPPFAVEAQGVLSDLRTSLGLELSGLRILNRYLVEGMSQEDFDACRDTVFSEPQVDITLDKLPDFAGQTVFATELLPGQFDQRADSCAQCISLSTGGERPTVRCAKLWVFEGILSPETLERIKEYLINPVESREASLEIPQTLETVYPAPADVAVLEGFIAMEEEALTSLLEELGLAMDLADLQFCQDYFRSEEKRDPTITEIRMIDTYWSDHCRHTTFLTHIDSVEIEPEYIARSYQRYRTMREALYTDGRPSTLMDMATIAAKALRKSGYLNRLDISDEINACSVNVRVEVDGQPQDWLIMFKNETHNHPTEIEPFGGAATCLGGAIRDPLSGRSFVYQAMRITGAANPLAEVSTTRPGKLPQKQLCQTAAAGYSSYGNQIGLATGLVHEIYHPGYEAKRMELGAVVGAVPAEHVVREVPAPGDKVILLGGRTGRDGCGGATGSSKSHTVSSLETCGSEVQKGNAPEERKIQRLFRNPDVTRLIRRCNDFGAGGVSVAIGELADGVAINLDAVPKKYEGLDGTELAISESQERMAVVVAAEDVEQFIRLADEENLEATVVAEVTETPRLTMHWRGRTIVNLSRKFLNSNGAAKHTSIKITAPAKEVCQDSLPVNRETILQKLSSLAFCSQKGLSDRFDSTVGSATVLMPYGGAYRRTPAQIMAAKLPVDVGSHTKACTLMSWAYDPQTALNSPYHAGYYAVVESVAKVIAAGGSRCKTWLTFQEYFEKLGTDPEKWGKPAAALLGALEAQMQLQLAAIGGKDSMSGTFEDLNVPPTLVSIALSMGQADKVISPEFKHTDSYVYLLAPCMTADGLPDFDDVRFIFDMVEQLVAGKRAIASWAVGPGGTAEGICKMCFGNKIGFIAEKPLSWSYQPGAFLLEAKEPFLELDKFLLGRTTADYRLELPGGEVVDLEEVQKAWEGTLQPVYPYLAPPKGNVEAFHWQRESVGFPSIQVQPASPRVAIPVFPGTNCEYDTAAAFQRAGAKPEIFVLRNLTGQAIAESVEAFSKLISRSQIVAIPGGFSGGDEPDGSGKFITAFLRNPQIRQGIEHLLQNRDGLMLGICNGFQALCKLGLVPYGEYRQAQADSPTLTYNQIGRHQSVMVRTRIASNKSPWLAGTSVGSVWLAPISNGEGRFIATEETIREMAANGQIATQYADPSGNPSMDLEYNPSGSLYAIEGITSPDGRVFGKMAHVERWSEDIYRNIPDCEYLDIFRCAVNYYSI